MKGIIIRFIIAALLAMAAEAMIPDGGVKDSAEKLISLAVVASTLLSIVELFKGA